MSRSENVVAQDTPTAAAARKRGRAETADAVPGNRARQRAHDAPVGEERCAVWHGIREDVMGGDDGDAGAACGADTPVLIAFDPGGTTGWAVMQVAYEALNSPDEYAVLDNVLYWACGQFVGPENDQIHAMAELCAAWPGAAVLAEDFVLDKMSRDRDLLSPVRITAGLSYALWLSGRDLALQGREAKAVVTDARMKDWGFYVRAGGAVHARDATRHALMFYRRARKTDPSGAALRSWAWPYLWPPKSGGRRGAGVAGVRVAAHG